MESKVDIWMPLAIGDYLADTSHLDTLQHGAYLLLLMHYWRKGPLPNDAAKLANIAKLSKDAWSMNEAVLMEFFTEGEDGLLHQKRSDREKEKWMKSRTTAQQKAAKAAKARWGDAPCIAPGNSQALPVQSPLPKPSPIPTKPKDRDQGLEKPSTGINANMMARGLCERLNLSRGMGKGTVYEAAYDLALQETQRGGDLEKLCERMVEAYQRWMSTDGLEYRWSPAKFFAEGHWLHPEQWPLKGGANAPKPKILSRPGE